MCISEGIAAVERLPILIHENTVKVLTVPINHPKQKRVYSLLC